MISGQLHVFRPPQARAGSSSVPRGTKSIVCIPPRFLPAGFTRCDDNMVFPLSQRRPKVPNLRAPDSSVRLFILTGHQTLTPRAQMLRSPRVGGPGYAHHFCFAKSGPEVLTYGRRGEGPAEASRQLKTSKMSLWKLRKAFGELLTLVPMSHTIYAMDGERFLLLSKTFFTPPYPTVGA